MEENNHGLNEVLS